MRHDLINSGREFGQIAVMLLGDESSPPHKREMEENLAASANGSTQVWTKRLTKREGLTTRSIWDIFTSFILELLHLLGKEQKDESVHNRES